MSTVIELAGYAAFIVAGWHVAMVLGLFVLGVVLLVVAHGVEGEPFPVPRFVLVWLGRVKEARLARLRARSGGGEATP